MHAAGGRGTRSRQTLGRAPPRRVSSVPSTAVTPTPSSSWSTTLPTCVMRDRWLSSEADTVSKVVDECGRL